MTLNKKYIMALSLMILLFAGCRREGVVVNVSPTELYIEDTKNKELKRFVSEAPKFGNFRIGDTVKVVIFLFEEYNGRYSFKQETTPSISYKSIEYVDTRARYNKLAQEKGMPCR